MGITGQVGELNGQRVALPRSFERVHPKDPGEDRLPKAYSVARDAQAGEENPDGRRNCGAGCWRETEAPAE